MFEAIGGVFIAISAFLMMIFHGKIAGISGIISNTISTKSFFSTERFWSLIFILGLIVGGLIMKFSTPSLFQSPSNLSFFELSIAGLLVGFGSRLGSGCTSGHAVCGVSRLSKRSITATFLFIIVAMVTVFIMKLL